MSTSKKELKMEIIRIFERKGRLGVSLIYYIRKSITTLYKLKYLTETI